jgi:hypothetical protein
VTPEPFAVAVDDDVLDDLRGRLRATRWFNDPTGGDTTLGVGPPRVRELVGYWADEFDWRLQERRLNTHPQFRVVLEGVPVHFQHVRGVGPDPLPLVLSHGWPWTFDAWSEVIGPLSDPGAHGGDPADAFELVIPSLPGFGFSTPAPARMTFVTAAELWHRLMTEVLGHPQYAAGGGDYGAILTAQLGHAHAADLVGIYLAHPFPPTTFSGARPWDVTGGSDTMPAEAVRAFVPHVALHTLEPHTLSVALHDSPAGMLAWLLARWDAWCDGPSAEEVFGVDRLLTAATIWWSTGSIASAARWWHDLSRHPWTPRHDRTPLVEAPAGITFLGGENPPGIATSQRVEAFLASPQAQLFQPVYLAAHERGGHFAPAEHPQAVIDDVRATFRALRSRPSE